jgi:hypothetical protein
MSPDLSQRIRAYAVQIENDSGHVTFAELEHMIGVLSEGQAIDVVEATRQIPSRWPRWAAAFAGALVLVIMAIGLPLWFFGSGDGVVADQTTMTVGATTSVAPSTTVAPTIVPPMVDAWQRVGGALMEPVVGTFDMTAAGSRLFVVGFDPGEGDYRQNGVIFASDDGVNWVRLAEDDPALSIGTVLMYSVTDGGPGLVAVGIGCENTTEGCRPHATAWTSVDGTSWTRTPEDATIFGDGTTQTSGMVGVADTSHGLIAVGSMDYWTFDDEGVEDLHTAHPAVWISDDGITWEHAWEGTGSAVERNDYSDVPVYMTSIVEGPDGRLVAVGVTTDENGEPIATVWTSVDGRQWERIEPDDTVFTPGTVMWDLTLGEHGYVAVGTDGDTDAAIWQSPDGATWTRVDTAAQSFDGIVSLGSVTALDSGYITVGSQAFIDATGDWVTLWTSPDGVTWDRVLTLDSGSAAAILAVDSQIAVVGQVIENDGADVDDYHAGVWMGPAFDPDAPPPEPGPPPEPAPTPEPAPEAAPTGIAAVEEGVSCEEIATREFSYAEAVSYWMRYDMPADLDPDANGLPCEAFYLTTDVAAVFGGPGALPVRLVSDLPAQLFEASGAAVDAGVICPSGTTEFTDEGTPPKQEGASGRWEDVYTCDDGSGTFTIGADGFIDVDERTHSGVWDIGSGTGRYETLTGGGGVFTGPTGPDTWSDDLIGRVTSETNDN